MAIKLSTGLRNYLLGTGGLSAALAGGCIKLYSGAPPASADDAATGTLLVTFWLNATADAGLVFDSPVMGVISKPESAIWSGLAAATGTAGYYRHVAAGDTGNNSSTARRIQGEVGLSKDMILTNMTITASTLRELDFYTVTLPA